MCFSSELYASSTTHYHTVKQQQTFDSAIGANGSSNRCVDIVGLFHRLLKLPVTLLRVYDLFDMPSSDQGVISDLLLVLVDVDSRLDAGASLVDLLGTLILCNSK